LALSDVVRVGSVGLRARRLRVALSSLGVAIGIAAMVAVLGISSTSSQALIAQIDKLGTNLLTVAPGQDFSGNNVELPETSTRMISRIASVLLDSAIGSVTANAYRTAAVPKIETNALSVEAASLNLLQTLEIHVAAGTYLNVATQHYPAAVLGSVAAERLGVDRPGTRILVGTTWFVVVGIVGSSPLVPELDSAVLIGAPIAERVFQYDGSPSKIYVRAVPTQVRRVQSLLAATANPENPQQVQVSNPSAALVARAEAKSAFTNLFLGLGVVALLVGGVGIANIMVISVLERRTEIGLRRALGATKGQIRGQFLIEALQLAALGGVAGVLIGAAATLGYAAVQHDTVVIPAIAVTGGLGAAVVVGGIAGLLPAIRAARLDPTESLRSV
jgi:putative ABC transport system permease protein